MKSEWPSILRRILPRIIARLAARSKDGSRSPLHLKQCNRSAANHDRGIQYPVKPDRSIGPDKMSAGLILMPVSSATKLTDSQQFDIPREPDSMPPTKVLSASRGLP